MALTPPLPSATATLQLNLLKQYLYFSTSYFLLRPLYFVPQPLALHGNFMGTGIWSVLFPTVAPAVRIVPHP